MLAEREVVRLVLGEGDETYANCTEGPVILGSQFAWRVWTKDAREYHAHYLVAPRDGSAPPQVFQDFLPFAAWLSDVFDLDREQARRLRSAEAEHARRVANIRIVVAVVIVISLLALAIYLVTVRGEALDIGHVITVMLGAGVAYLLGEWTRKSPQP